MHDYSNVSVEQLVWPTPPGGAQPEGSVFSTGLRLSFVYPTRTENRWVVMNFQSPELVSYGTPNSSELDTHPLSGKVPCGTLCKILNSPWTEYAKKMNMGHAQYDKDYWERINHYIAFLWDYTFECLAIGYDSAEVQGEYSEVLTKVFD